MGYVCTLLDSLQQHTDHSVVLYALVVDRILPDFLAPTGLKLLQLSDLGNVAAPFVQKYGDVLHSELRWALKPVLIRYILEIDRVESCIFLDNDLYFFNNYDFLFDILKTKHFLLTPHFRASSPTVDTSSFLTTVKDGFFNAGLVGASRNGRHILDWWMQLNLFACERNDTYQLYVDQRYLDFIPLLFENVHINTHKGVNLGIWHTNPVFSGDGLNLTIDHYPIVCFHFVTDVHLFFSLVNDSRWTVWNKMLPYFEHYQAHTQRYVQWIDSKKSRWQSMAEEQLRWINQLERQQAELWQRVEAGNTQRNQLQHQTEVLQAEHTALQAEHTALQTEHTALQAEHQAFRAYYRVLENRSVLGWLRKLKRFLNDHD